ncbi:VOC family protein [Mycolicibacterium sp. 3033]|nr:VOC family protein [Mycolicibacterium aurantiacum]
MGVDRVTVVVESWDPLSLGEFWAQLLGCRLTADSRHAGGYAAEVGDSIALLFLSSTASRADISRHHLDVASTSLEHQAALMERAQILGARRADVGQGDVPWHVMADPENNLFCILEPRDEYRCSGALAAVVTHAKDPLTVGGFWSAVVDAPMTADHPELASVRYGSAAPALEFVRHPEPPGGRGRIHLRLAATDRHTDPAVGDSALPCHLCGDSYVALTDPDQNHLCSADSPSAAEKHWTPTRLPR